MVFEVLVLGSVMLGLVIVKAILGSQSKLIGKFLEKMKWSPILRGQTKLFFPNCVKTLIFINLFC